MKATTRTPKKKTGKKASKKKTTRRTAKARMASTAELERETSGLGEVEWVEPTDPRDAPASLDQWLTRLAVEEVEKRFDREALGHLRAHLLRSGAMEAK